MDNFVIIIILFLLFFIFFENKLEHFRTLFTGTNILVGSSDRYDRTIYASNKFNTGDIIESCPIIKDESSQINNGVIGDYLFKGTENKSIVGLGYCSLYNHSDDNNATWKINEQDNKMDIIAIKDIKDGEEIFLNYGDGYWKSRPSLIKK